MTELEKVMKELSWLISNFPLQKSPTDAADRMCNAINVYCNDALALLKEQEPRVMTIREARGYIGNPVWVEERVVVTGYWEILFDVDGEAFHMTTGQVEFGGMLTGHSMFAVNCYGTDFRFWTSRPSPEQMANTPWEGEKDHEA